MIERDLSSADGSLKGNDTPADEKEKVNVSEPPVSADSALMDKLCEYSGRSIEELKNGKVADVQEVLEFLTHIMRGQQETTGGSGRDKSDSAASATSRIKCAELIGKRYGMFKDTADVNGAVPVVLDDDVKE